MRSRVIHVLSYLSLVGACVALWPLGAAAQPSAATPDLRGIAPFMMLVVDTSGSMERLPGCVCTTPSCTECLPDCTGTNTSGVPPADKKNRWALTLEALTGTFTDFQCEQLPRTNAADGWTYDLAYYLPYHQPWDCSGPAPGPDNTKCDYTAAFVGAAGTSPLQNADGVLDQYAGNIRFGLMTFDGYDTYVGAPPLVPATSFNTGLSNGPEGLWSYGGGKPIHYPGCLTDYMMDTGARSSAATEGGLVSLDSCAMPPCDMAILNTQIQDQLLRARPYGGTPIAASLDDLYDHIQTDLAGDIYGSCRDRYAMLITDGYPDQDYRDLGCDCTQNIDPMASDYCGDDAYAAAVAMGVSPLPAVQPQYDPANMKCPYPKPEDAARYLYSGRPSDSAGVLSQLFVVGLSITDANVRGMLNLIANQGGTTTPVDGMGNFALFADNLNSLFSNLNGVFAGVAPPISRTIPAYVNGGTLAKQYQVSTGFQPGIGLVDPSTGHLEPWTGIIERYRFDCSGTMLNSLPLTDAQGDNFHVVLNGPTGDNRYLWTVNPLNYAGSGASREDHLHSGDLGAPCGLANSCGVASTRMAITKAVPPTDFALLASDTVLRDQVVDWMHGAPGSVRDGKRLGDIFHSSPVIVDAPRFDTGDEAFNIFRRRPEVRDRPMVLYVGSNDGILHAFSMEDYNGAQSFASGQEMWGFVPPMLMDDLPTQLNAHLFSMDGTPAVQDVFFQRDKSAQPVGDEYHTVLITGMRGGGKAYIALDVTDPLEPEFLWQFTHPAMGYTYAQPVIGQATFRFTQGGTSNIETRAIAILPGGTGVQGPGPNCSGADQPSFRDASAGGAPYYSLNNLVDAAPPQHPFRPTVPCWEAQGRGVFIVDVETGKLIKEIYREPSGELMFPSPIVSTPVAYLSDIGSSLSRAFVVDADGVIWRIDLSSPNQGAQVDDALDGWTARPFHDIYWDAGFDEGEVSYERPLLSVDDAGRLVVLAGTGDTDNFQKPTVRNRVVSLTETTYPIGSPAAGPDSFKAVINWEKRAESTTRPLQASELITGEMELQDGNVFFGSFISVVGGNACDFGAGRVWAVDYIKHDPTDPNSGVSPQTFGPLETIPAGAVSVTTPDGAVVTFNVDAASAAQNVLMMGLNLVQRPTCTIVDPVSTNTIWGESLPMVTHLSSPQEFLVMQASGGQQVGALGSLQMAITPPARHATVTSWVSE